MFFKIFWIMRAFIYKIFFKEFGLISYIGKPVFLKGIKNISIGKKVRIFPGSRMETHDSGEIIIEGNVSIGQNFHAISSSKKLTIGKKTTISGNVLITNTDHKYQEIEKHIMEQPLIVKETKIGENCFIGYGTVIQAGTILGRQCIVGSNSVVRGNFPDYCVIIGAPARIVKKYDYEKKEWVKI